MKERELDKRWERRCPKCEGVYPPMRTFKWNADLNNRNRDWHRVVVCDNCYQDLGKKSYEINSKGKIVVGRDFYRGDSGFNRYRLINSNV